MGNSALKNKCLGSILLLFFLVVLIGYVTALPSMMNYLEVGSFWRNGLITGALLGLILGLLTTQRFADTESVARLRIFFMVFFFCLLAFPLLLNWTNKTPTPESILTQVTFESELARFGSRFGQIKNSKTAAPTTYVLFFVLDQKLYRVSAREAFFPGAQAGDQVELNIFNGRWGYRWVALPKD